MEGSRAQADAYIGLDLGTGSVKALAAASGGVLAVEVESYPLYHPRPGWAEQLPDEWWAAACAATRRLLARPELAGHRIAAVGLSGQMHGATVLDSHGRVLRPSLIWADQRGASELVGLASRIAPTDVLAIAGSLPHASSTLAKLLWLRAREPDILGRVAHVLLPKDDLRRRLTGAYATDPTDASGTLLFDIRACRWSPALLRAIDLDPAVLPQVLESTAVAGHVTSEAATATGLPHGTPVVTGAGDAECAAFGVGLECALDDALVSIGTAGQVFAVTAEPTIDGLGRVHALRYVLPERWHVMGAILAAGHALRWLADLAGGRDVGRLIDAAADIAPGAGGLVFLPYLMGERSPHMDPAARAALVGLRATHTLANVTRAVVEGVAFALRDSLKILRELGITPKRLLFTGGPARTALWCRVLADVLALPVITADVEHGSALGAARLAARACGDEFVALATREFPTSNWLSGLTEPDPVVAGQYDRVYEAYRALYPALRHTSHVLGALSPGGEAGTQAGW